MNVATPGNSKIYQEEEEKIPKHQELKIKLEILREKKATVAPIVIGTPGAIPGDTVKTSERYYIATNHAEELLIYRSLKSDFLNRMML